MFIQIDTTDYANQWAAFSLTDAAGGLLHIGVARMTELTTLAGVALPPDTTCYLTVLHVAHDPLIAANHATAAADQKGRTDLKNAIAGWVVNFRSPRRRVQCVETGQMFNTAQAACDAFGIMPSNMSNHLRGSAGFKTVKGKTFRWVV